MELSSSASAPVSTARYHIPQTKFSNLASSTSGFISQSPSFYSASTNSNNFPACKATFASIPTLPSSLPPIRKSSTSSASTSDNDRSKSSSGSDGAKVKRNLTGHEIAALEGACSLADLNDPPGGIDQRPTYAYVTLIRYAILGSPSQRLTLQEIYDAIESRYSFYSRSSSKGWKNSIRHNLSLNKCFKREIRDILSPGKGGCWVVDMDEEFSTSRQRRKRGARPLQQPLAEATRHVPMPSPSRFWAPTTDFPSLSPSRSTCPYSALSPGAPMQDSSLASAIPRSGDFKIDWQQWNSSQSSSADVSNGWRSVQVGDGSSIAGSRC